MNVKNSIEKPDREVPMRKLERYVARYGPETGPKLFHLLQSQAGHASVSARLRRKLAALAGPRAVAAARKPVDDALPLFPEAVANER
jgi:hypothetical protein